MRRLVAASDELRAMAEEPAEQWPLMCNPCGQPISKATIVEVYRALAEAAGAEHANLTGHSARVAGAMRMALAGHSEWLIQLFGRWGSSAVLLYIREALLGRRGGVISRVTEGTG
eukprot:10068478-Heterocapsa_arctica.AAC.1